VDNQQYTQNNDPNNFAYPPAAPGSLPRPLPPARTTPSAEFSVSSRTFVGFLSLLVGLIASGLFVLLIFHTSLIATTQKVYTWIAIVLALGITSVLLAIISMQRRASINPMGLLGLIISIVLCFQCIIVGIAYIKIKAEITTFTDNITNFL
jgi:hypothetical protein